MPPAGHFKPIILLNASVQYALLDMGGEGSEQSMMAEGPICRVIAGEDERRNRRTGWHGACPYIGGVRPHKIRMSYLCIGKRERDTFRSPERYVPKPREIRSEGPRDTSSLPDACNMPDPLLNPTEEWQVKVSI